MFIPINIEQREYKKNDIVVSIKKISNGYGFFTVGHEFTVIEKVPKYSSYRLVDNELKIIIKAEPENFTLKTEIEDARKIWIDKTEKTRAIQFIRNWCPHKDYGYDDRDRYDTCKLKKYTGFSSDSCRCNLSCVNHIDRKKIDKDGFMKVYLRKLKIKKIID